MTCLKWERETFLRARRGKEWGDTTGRWGEKTGERGGSDMVRWGAGR